MLNRLRQTAPAVALLLCTALLTTWITGAHAHLHVGVPGHGHMSHAGAGPAPQHEAGFSHQLDIGHAVAAEVAGNEHEEEHVHSHPVSLIHQDGHEDIEVQALQAPAVKSLLDLPPLALLCVVALVLTQSRAPVVATRTDPPGPRRPHWFLRPPLRGPPSSSAV